MEVLLWHMVRRLLVTVHLLRGELLPLLMLLIMLLLLSHCCVVHLLFLMLLNRGWGD